MSDETPKAAKPRNHILSRYFEQDQSGYKTNIWSATIAVGHTLEDLADPEYWMHVAARVTINDHIRCYWEDGTKYAELLVTSRTNASARTAELLSKDLRAAAAPIDLGAELSKFEISFAGPANGYRVIRKANREVVKDRFQTEDMARQFVFALVGGPQKVDAPLPPSPAPTAAGKAEAPKPAATKAT